MFKVFAKNSVKLFLLAGVSCLISSCGTAALKSSAAVSPGMSSQEVIAIMGPPEDRQFRGSDEAWQYCSTGFESDTFVIVWIYSGVVNGLQTYKNRSTGLCSSFFRTVNWEAAPDRIYEIRQR